MENNTNNNVVNADKSVKIVSKTAKPPRKKSKIILVILLILIIIAVLLWQARVHKDLFVKSLNNHKNIATPLTKANPTINPSTPESPATDSPSNDSKTLDNGDIKDLKQWQDNINQQLQELKDNPHYKANDNQINSDYQLRKSEELLTSELTLYKQNLNDIRVSLWLIDALKTNTPFLPQLLAFKQTQIYTKNNKSFNNLDEIAIVGVPTNNELASQFAELKPQIIVYYYSFNTTIWGNIKHILVHFINIEKYKHFKETDKSKLSYILYAVNNYLNNGELDKALQLVEKTKLTNMPNLQTWIENLKTRIILNNVVNSLQQYLLNYVPIESKP